MRPTSRTMHKLIPAVLVCALVGACPALAQELVQGVAVNRSTVNNSATITTGSTFQVLTITGRQALTIQNNNTNGDNCWVYVGSGSPTKATSILLTPGGSYTRYFPYVPSDAIQATCANTNDTLYVDTQ